MLPLYYAMAAPFINAVPTNLETNAGEKTSAQSQSGIVNTQWTVDNTDKSQQYEIDYQQQDSSVLYAPMSTTYTVPIITISGSQVKDTGNTGYANPTTFTPSVTQSASAAHSDTEEQGINLTEIIIPVAVVGGIAALGYALITTLGGK